MKLPVLISYAYWDKHMLKVLQEHKDDVDLLIDSGAYTAYTKGKLVELSMYEEFIRYLEEYLEFNYFVLDVIGEAEATKKNFLSMYERGYAPIPIFTRGSKLTDIEFYYEYDELIGLGGISISGPETAGYVKYLMNNYIHEQKIHWLGWSKRDFIFHYRPFGFDCNSWHWGARYGDLYYVKNNQILNYSHQQRGKGKKPPREVKKLINKMVVEAKEIGDPANWKGHKSIPQRCTALAYIQYCKLLKEKLNVKMYLAIADTPVLVFALDTFCNYIKED